MVTVTAMTAPQMVLKFGERPDLRDNYARLIVTQGGRPVEVPIAISDPGPTGDKDYIRLDPGQSLMFEHRGDPYALSELPSGSYLATVKLYADWRSEPVTSNIVSFDVGK